MSSTSLPAASASRSTQESCQNFCGTSGQNVQFLKFRPDACQNSERLLTGFCQMAVRISVRLLSQMFNFWAFRPEACQNSERLLTGVCQTAGQPGQPGQTWSNPVNLVKPGQTWSTWPNLVSLVNLVKPGQPGQTWSTWSNLINLVDFPAHSAPSFSATHLVAGGGCRGSYPTSPILVPDTSGSWCLCRRGWLLQPKPPGSSPLSHGA